MPSSLGEEENEKAANQDWGHLADVLAEAGGPRRRLPSMSDAAAGQTPTPHRPQRLGFEAHCKRCQ